MDNKKFNKEYNKYWKENTILLIEKDYKEYLNE